MAVHLGIDLGTTNSAAVVFDGTEWTVVRTRDGGLLTPSVVRLDSKGRVTVGARARKHLDRDPDNTRAGFKRLMGTSEAAHFVACDRRLTAVDLSAEVLRSIRDDVREQLGVAPDNAVISVPALFELPQTSATSEAARRAGFQRVELIQEPVASALAAGWSAESDAGGPWMVYDLGGGTFDASLLETRDGLLRVVGHDGDNFLGGRDLDRALVDVVLERLRADGTRVERSDPAHAAALRALTAAVEEAKIDLSRRDEVELSLPELFTIAGRRVDVELTLERRVVEALLAPLVDRSIRVCERLLSAHGLRADDLRRIVLVGGPTVMPALRARLAAAFGDRFATGHDPMTLVAAGAALYAATAGLDARPVAAPPPSAGRRLWLQYPAMSSDVQPFVVGRLLDGDGPAPASVRFRRDGWDGPWIDVDAEGAVVGMVDLTPRSPNRFSVEGRDARGEAVPLQPESFTIVQGLTLTDPPLALSVGVALVGDRVQVYLERGTPLPARRSFVHQTLTALVAGDAEARLTIPIVQGELERAHLCRLVGQIVVTGADLPRTLPSGSDVEVTLAVDRGGRLEASAHVRALDVVLEQVAHLVAPDASPEALHALLAPLGRRLSQLRGRADRHADVGVLDRLIDLEWTLQDAASALDAARGGDADAAQQARRA